jgi:hypothetical protein
MLKKVKSAQMSACPNLSVGRVFTPNQKHNRSADRQMTDLILRDTLILGGVAVQCAPVLLSNTTTIIPQKSGWGMFN